MIYIINTIDEIHSKIFFSGLKLRFKSLAMKKLVLLLTGFIFLSFSTEAKIWRLNSNIYIDADLRTLQGANDSSFVNAGDTLYCENGSYLGDATMTKSLTIIGPGYFLAQYDSTYPNPASASVGNLTFESGSGGSRLIGMNVTNQVYLRTGADNLIIERSRIRTLTDNGSYSNLTVRQCYIENGGVYLTGAISAYFQNNIIRGEVKLIGSIQSLEFSNNVVIYDRTGYLCDFDNGNIYNNVVINTNPSGTYEGVYSDAFLNTANNSFTTNVMSNSPNVNFPNNFFNATADTVFTLQGSQEEQLELKTGSPAIGYGSTGGDCGVYGGVYPYVKSGFPLGLPRIFEATIPNRVDAATGVNVNIKVKIQDE